MARLSWPGDWLHTKWFTRSQTVTHPSSNPVAHGRSRICIQLITSPTSYSGSGSGSGSGRDSDSDSDSGIGNGSGSYSGVVVVVLVVMVVSMWCIEDCNASPVGRR